MKISTSDCSVAGYVYGSEVTMIMNDYVVTLIALVSVE